MSERFDIDEVIRILGLEIRAEQADEGRNFDVACRIALNKLEKCKEYEDLEKRLEKMFGGYLTLEKYVDELEFALKEPDSPHPMNARILTYAESAKWDEYCKLEEQGLLLRLPCKVGDTVYTACSWGIERGVVGNIKIMFDKIFVNNIHGGMIGEARNIFLTKSAAEKQLRELEGK